MTSPPAQETKIKKSLFASRTVPLDLALVEMGDADTLQRVENIFQRNETAEVIVLLQRLKFVRDKAVLQGAVNLLANTNRAYEVSSVDGKPLDTSRVCDVALWMLHLRFNQPYTLSKAKVFDTHFLPHASDDELADAIKKYTALASDMK